MEKFLKSNLLEIIVQSSRSKNVVDLDYVSPFDALSIDVDWTSGIIDEHLYAA